MAVEPSNQKKSKCAFSMKMPDWFIDNLSAEEKKNLINRIKTKRVNSRKLTYEELREKKFWVKKS